VGEDVFVSVVIELATVAGSSLGSSLGLAKLAAMVGAVTLEVVTDVVGVCLAKRVFLKM
jgi:O-succinylbenzoate synthase